MNRLPGTRNDHRVKRLYLGRLRVAQARYEAAMIRPRRRLRNAKAKVTRLSSDEATLVDMVEEAFARFELARDRAERAHTRRRLRAAAWLERQDVRLAFRHRDPRAAATGAEVRA